MSGRYVRLRPGRYTLDVSGGEGPAGVRRGDGRDVQVDVEGGRVDFEVGRREAAYYWWRGPRERPGVRLLSVMDGRDDAGAGSARQRGHVREEPDARERMGERDARGHGEGRSWRASTTG